MVGLYSPTMSTFSLSVIFSSSPSGEKQAFTRSRWRPALRSSLEEQQVQQTVFVVVPAFGLYDFVQAMGIMGSFFLPSTALSVGFMPATTWPSTSGFESPGSGKRTP